MSSLLNRLRKLLRFFAASALWSHALLFMTIPAPRIADWAARLHLTSQETWVVLLLAIFSVLSSYGIKRFAVDLIYIYFFPFIFLFLIARLSYRLFRFFFLQQKSSESAIVKPPPNAAALEIQTVQGATAQSESKEVPRASRTLKSFLREASRPFRQFTLLW